jgi:hypothetical protein
VDAKYRDLVPRSGLAAFRVEASLELIHDLERRAAVSELSALIATV